MSKRNWVLLAIIIVILIIVVFITNKETTQRDTHDEIIIGAILPLSGKNAVFGEEIRNAIELAREEVNSTGGINGKKLTVVYEDDKAEPGIGASAMQKLVTVNKVPVVLGSWASGVVMAIAPIAEKNQTVVMASALSDQITKAGDYIFRMQPPATFYTVKSVEALRNQGVNTAAVLYINNEFGVSLKNSFVNDFEESKGRIVALESYEQGSNDFRTQLSKIKTENPGVVFIAGYQDTIAVIKQMKELGINNLVLAGPPFENQETIAGLGELAEGVLYPYHYVVGSSSKAQEYETKYLKRYGMATGGFAPLMYDATNIIAVALKKCDVDSVCIKDELYSTEYSGVTGMVSFDANGDPLIPIVMKTVKDGNFVKFEK